MMPARQPTTTVTLSCGHTREMRPGTVLVLVCQQQPADRLLCFDCGVIRMVASSRSELLQQGSSP